MMNNSNGKEEEKKNQDPEFMQDERYKNLDPRVSIFTLTNPLDG